mmetsp:Transcript_1089/g.4211  ORF Transcript_1089/g.4211 Transcript_1089/m.4211 type:complete len:201 (+) Transcript_1089:2-604(+)
MEKEGENSWTCKARHGHVRKQGRGRGRKAHQGDGEGRGTRESSHGRMREDAGGEGAAERSAGNAGNLGQATRQAAVSRRPTSQPIRICVLLRRSRIGGDASVHAVSVQRHPESCHGIGSWRRRRCGNVCHGRSCATFSRGGRGNAQTGQWVRFGYSSCMRHQEYRAGMCHERGGMCQSVGCWKAYHCRFREGRNPCRGPG